MFSISSDKIVIDFNGIIRSDFCLTSTGPASTTIDLGSLSNGNYDLEIQVEGKKSVGLLIVTPDFYAINLDKPRQLQIKFSPLIRVPDNTIWGTIGYASSSYSAMAQTFIDSLQYFGATPGSYLPGDYNYFEINSSGQIISPSNGGGYYFAQSYIFNYAENTSTLKTLVNNYGHNSGDTLSIILYTTKGEIFRSWMH